MIVEFDNDMYIILRSIVLHVISCFEFYFFNLHKKTKCQPKYIKFMKNYGKTLLNTDAIIQVVKKKLSYQTTVTIKPLYIKPDCTAPNEYTKIFIPTNDL